MTAVCSDTQILQLALAYL